MLVHDSHDGAGDENIMENIIENKIANIIKEQDIQMHEQMHDILVDTLDRHVSSFVNRQGFSEYSFSLKLNGTERIVEAYIEPAIWKITINLSSNCRAELSDVLNRHFENYNNFSGQTSIWHGQSIIGITKEMLEGIALHEIRHWRECPASMSVYSTILDACARGLADSGNMNNGCFVNSSLSHVANMFMDTIINMLSFYDDSKIPDTSSQKQYNLQHIAQHNEHCIEQVQNKWQRALGLFYIKEGVLSNGFSEPYRLFVDIQSKLGMQGHELRTIAEQYGTDFHAGKTGNIYDTSKTKSFNTTSNTTSNTKDDNGKNGAKYNKDNRKDRLKHGMAIFYPAVSSFDEKQYAAFLQKGILVNGTETDNDDVNGKCDEAKKLNQRLLSQGEWPEMAYQYAKLFADNISSLKESIPCSIFDAEVSQNEERRKEFWKEALKNQCKKDKAVKGAVKGAGKGAGIDAGNSMGNGAGIVQLFLPEAMEHFYSNAAEDILAKILQDEKNEASSAERYLGRNLIDIDNAKNLHRIDWGRTYYHKSIRMEEFDDRILLSEKSNPAAFSTYSGMKEKTGFSDTALIIDSSGSMGFKPFSLTNKYSLLVLSAYSLFKFVERNNYDTIYACLNFSSNAIFSGWHSKNAMRPVKEALFSYQGGGTELKREWLAKLNESAMSPYWSLIITDGDISGWQDTADDILKRIETHPVTIIQISPNGYQSAFYKKLLANGADGIILAQPSDLSGAVIGAAARVAKGNGNG